MEEFVFTAEARSLKTNRRMGNNQAMLCSSQLFLGDSPFRRCRLLLRRLRRKFREFLSFRILPFSYILLFPFAAMSLELHTVSSGRNKTSGLNSVDAPV